MNMLDDLAVTYRPVIGFAPNCHTCGGVIFRYGPATSTPGKGMSQAMVDAQDKCHGHAMFGLA